MEPKQVLHCYLDCHFPGSLARCSNLPYSLQTPARSVQYFDIQHNVALLPFLGAAERRHALLPICGYQVLDVSPAQCSPGFIGRGAEVDPGVDTEPGRERRLQ